MTNQLPALTGSDKQIAFANDIRDRTIKSLISYHLLGGRTQAQIDASLEAQIYPMIASKTDASLWIEAHYAVMTGRGSGKAIDLIKAVVA